MSVLDFEWEPLPPGPKKGVLSHCDFYYGELTALKLTYSVEYKGEKYALSEFLPFMGEKTHPRYTDTAKGKARLKQLLPREALSAIAESGDLTELAEALVGLPVVVMVGVSIKNGLAVPYIANVKRDQGPKTDPEKTLTVAETFADDPVNPEREEVGPDKGHESPARRARRKPQSPSE
jgi:hypothetical protein